jgi:hypothetical protein
MDLDSGSQSFHAIAPPGRSRSHVQRLEIQSRLRLKGVSVVDPRFNKAADPFVLLVRSAEDIEAAKTYCTPTYKDADIVVANAYRKHPMNPSGETERFTR